ncbi:MAG: Zn-ribbon domain-containing OB-fold protein [bacterium]
MSVPRFWREIPERYNLEASKCGNCATIHFPARTVCPKCRRASIGKMTAVKLSGRGRILEWTRVHRPAPGYEFQVPYALALVQTEEGPLVTGQVVDSPADAVRAGAAVKSVFRRLGADGDSGVIYYGTKWQVVPGDVEPAVVVPEPAKRRRLGRKR